MLEDALGIMCLQAPNQCPLATFPPSFYADVRSTLMMLLQLKAVFGTIEETKIAIAEGVQLDCHMMGNITATIRAKLAVWDAVRVLEYLFPS